MNADWMKNSLAIHRLEECLSWVACEECFSELMLAESLEVDEECTIRVTSSVSLAIDWVCFELEEEGGKHSSSRTRDMLKRASKRRWRRWRWKDVVVTKRAYQAMTKAERRREVARMRARYFGHGGCEETIIA